LVEISAAHRELNEMPAALGAFARAESIAKEALQPTDRRYVGVWLESARLALARKEPAAAVTSAQAALQLIDEQDPGRLALIQCVLAQALAGTGKVAEARELLESALATRRRIMPPEHWMIADVERQLKVIGEAG
jgi:lipopolysaccharide biosynthesis regulator YciM